MFGFTVVLVLMKRWGEGNYKIHIDMDYCTNLFGDSEAEREKYLEYAQLDFESMKDHMTHSQGIIYSCYCKNKYDLLEIFDRDNICGEFSADLTKSHAILGLISVAIIIMNIILKFMV